MRILTVALFLAVSSLVNLFIAAAQLGPGGILTQASMIDRSGAIASGGLSQLIAPANTSRKRIVIQNLCTATSQGISASENLFINFTAAASGSAGTSLELVPCGSYDSGFGPVSTESITVVAATTGHKYVAKEQ